MNEGSSPSIQIPPQKKKVLPVIIFILVGVLAVGSGIFFFTKIKGFVASRNNNVVGQQENSDTQSSSDSGQLVNDRTYMDSKNRFSFKYSKDTILESTEDGSVKLSKADKEAIVITPMKLEKSSVKDEVESQIKQIGASTTADITKIGSRAGYIFNYKDTKYMYFPLGLDSVLEIKVETTDQTFSDGLIQTIEFLPIAQAS